MTPPKLEEWAAETCPHESQLSQGKLRHQCAQCLRAYIDAVRKDEREKMHDRLLSMVPKILEIIYPMPNESEAGDDD